MIAIQGLQKRFGTNTVLDNLTFRISEGDVFGIVGHSGAGKSTLLRCINGLETYDKGSLRVMGHEVGTLPHRR
jgi:ABC-type polar amino acid transport system, ATPase component